VRKLLAVLVVLCVNVVGAAAQSAPELRGTVRDSTGRTIPRVEVSSGRTKTLSDENGNFRLAPVPTGRITVRFERDGLLLGEVEANITADTVPDVGVDLLLNKVAPREFFGVVADSMGRALPDVNIEIVGSTLTARTDSMGRFLMQDLPPRLHVVRARKLGYNPSYLTINLSDTTSSRARIVMRQFAGQNLGLVVVKATRYPVRMGPFLRRLERKSGWGTLMSAEDVNARHPQRTTDLFQTIAGVKVNRDAGGSLMVTGRGGCVMALFINGFPAPQLSGSSIDDNVNSLEIAGLEVYNGIAGVPADLTMGPANPCGTIAIWTK
jgi:Carboxypeptidase regulatory-like domain